MNHAEPPPTDALLDAWRAWHDGGEEEREEAYRQAVRSARSGPALTAGEIVADRYRVEAHRSDGLLAATWEATDLVDDERVLLKTLHARFLHDEGSIERFHQAIAHQAEHAERGIVPILATGEPWFGFHWAVTGFAPTVLTQVVADLDEIGARQVLLDVARSLEAAHLCGLSHGHVAPESIVLDARGSASLADFGLQPAMIDGPFAAPERADPDLPPSPPTDRYGLAMLAGFVFGGGKLPYWAARDPERFLRDLGVPDDLGRSLVASVHWDPAERPDGIGDLVRTLRGSPETVRTLIERARAADRHEAALEHLRHLMAVSGGDPDLRVELAQTLALAGRDRQAIDQLYAALRATRLRGVETALTELRRLVERTGETGPLIDALERRAEEPGAHRDVILLEVARLRARNHEGDVAGAWQAALAAHTRRDQARVALWALLELAAENEDWPAFVVRGAELMSYVDDKALLARRLGQACQDYLGDPHAALVWLEQARASGDTDPDLEHLIETLRAQRGDWPAVLELLEQRTEHTDQPEATLLRAARLARRAAQQPERARALYAQLVQLGQHREEATAYLAAEAGHEGRADDELHWLRQRLEADDPSPAERLRAAELLRLDGDGDATDGLVDAVLADHPTHVEAQGLRAVRSRDRGEPATARDAVEVLTSVLTPRTPLGAAVWLQQAELLWRAGDRVGSYTTAERILGCHPQLPEAHWALSRATFGGPISEEDGGLHDAPGGLGPPEVLARFLAEHVHQDALTLWADADPLGIPGAATTMQIAAAVVDGLMASGQVLELLGALEAIEGIDTDAAAMVRRLWEGSSEGLSVERVLRWGEGRPTGTRTLLPQRPTSSPWLGEARSLDDLLEPASTTVNDPHDAPAPPPEPPLLETPETLVLVAYSGDARQAMLTLHDDDIVTIGGSPDDTLEVAGLPAGHGRVHRHGAQRYLLASDGLRVGPRGSEERRLLAGMELDLAGVPLRVTTLTESLPVPALQSLPPLTELEDEQTIVLERHAIDAPTALFYEEGGHEFIVPLVDFITKLPSGDDLMAEHDGWRVIRDDGPDAFVVDGDRFVSGNLTYHVRRIESITPVPARRLDLGDADAPRDGVPTLHMATDTPMARVVALREHTTIGRGRDMDLKISRDAKISRHHATIEIRDDDEVFIVDAGSSNGTFVDGAEVIDEMLLREGQTIQVGDTHLEYHLGTATAAKLSMDPPRNDEHDATSLSPGPRHKSPRPSLAEGRHRVGVANQALAPLLAAVDDTHGVGAGATVLQQLLEADSSFQRLFEDVEAKPTGIPVLPVLFNQARLNDGEQRTLLSTGLVDLVERATERLTTRIDPAAVDDVLEEVARSDYRKHLRM